MQHKEEMNSERLRSTVIALGVNRGNARVYLQGQWLAVAGFTPSSKFTATFEKDKVVLTLDVTGNRTVSGKKDGTIPVVDINSSELGAALAHSLNGPRLQVSTYQNRIVITPAHTAILMSSRQPSNSEGSLFSGGGFLTQAASSLGFVPAFGVELDERYANIYERNHPSAQMFNCSVEDVAWEDMKVYRPLGLLTMGIPCEPFSNIRTLNKGGQVKRDRELPREAHELGDMTFWALRAVEATNPYTVLIENVPAYLQSASCLVLHSVLRRLGYHVDSKVIDPLAYGELTGRKRAIIVAHSQPIVWPEESVRNTRRLSDILDTGPHDWFDRTTKAWVFNHWDAQTAKGNGFAAQQLHGDSLSVGTIKKRYFAGQGDNPVVMHPTLPETARWLTLPEVKRLHGIDPSYFTGSSKTIAGEVIGQGVLVSTMSRIIESVTGQKRLAA